MIRHATRFGVLYISYDGMLEPLGQSQVLGYLERLAEGREIHLLSFEKQDDWLDAVKRERVATRIRAAGIHWHPRRYHKRPSALATAYDIAVGTISALWLTFRYRLRLVHARSDVPALMAVVVKQLAGAKFLFDMRGFWADERVDGDLWPRDGRLYRIAKWLERRFLLSANHVVSLTHAAIREMQKFPWLEGNMPPMTVIPTCADLQRFTPRPSPEAGFVLGYVGSVGTWYMFDEVVACFALLRQYSPEARLLVINRNEHAYIRECLHVASIPADAFELRAAEHADVPQQMARMTAGVFFIRPVFSKQASAPTKLAEFLGCGIPCLSNAGVGDLAEILEGERTGVVVQGFDRESLASGVQQLLTLLEDTGVHDRCVASAHRHFSLDRGVQAYEEIYAALEQD